MENTENKKKQRDEVKARLAKLLDKQKRDASARIKDAVLSYLSSLSARSVFCFLSSENEPDTIEIIRELLKRGYAVGVPKLRGGKMLVIEIDEDCEFAAGQYGLIEPVSDKQLSGVQIVLAPLLAFDKDLNRLGRGGGYYDRYFSNCDAKKIGLAFSCQELEKVVCGENDKKLDIIITEKELIFKG
jgi:5-formyltetrahydrofolate cyclo-ligase